MRKFGQAMVAVAFLSLLTSGLHAQDAQSTRRDPQPQIRYPLGVDSLPSEDVPKGKLEGPYLFHSEIIADTVRKYWVYVPSQYSPDEPACLLVFQDSARAINPDGVLRVPQVLDNLIAKQQIPVTIGIFITPGQRGDEFPESIGTGNPDNRDREYDVLNDAYARMLIEEILPEVGRKYKFTDDPAGRAIGGSSSGAICTVTVAWERPDQFRNVVSMIGSYTNIHGGHVYPDLVREADKKPIRIFLQDGENDLRSPDNLERDWFLQNQKMVAAFQDKGYDMAHVFGKGGHADDHGGAMLPQMLRWIWRDYPGVEPPTTDLVAEAAAIEPEVGELFRGYDAGAHVDPSGIYTWERRFGNATSLSKLTIEWSEGKLAGTYESTRPGVEPTITELLDPVLEGNKLVFDVKSSFRDREFTSTFSGIVTGRGIEGWRMMNFGGQNRDVRWTADRETPWGLLSKTNAADSWQFELHENGQGALSIEGDEIIFQTTKAGIENWHVQAYQSGVPLADGKTYELKFTAKSPSNSTVLVMGTIAQDDWHGIGLQEEVVIGESFREHTFRFTASDVGPSNRIGFVLGADEGTIHVKDMSLIEQ